MLRKSERRRRYDTSLSAVGWLGAGRVDGGRLALGGVESWVFRVSRAAPNTTLERDAHYVRVPQCSAFGDCPERGLVREHQCNRRSARLVWTSAFERGGK